MEYDWAWTSWDVIERGSHGMSLSVGLTGCGWVWISWDVTECGSQGMWLKEGLMGCDWVWISQDVTGCRSHGLWLNMGLTGCNWSRVSWGVTESEHGVFPMDSYLGRILFFTMGHPLPSLLALPSSKPISLNWIFLMLFSFCSLFYVPTPSPFPIISVLVMLGAHMPT